MSGPINAYFVCGGKYHDMDFARRKAARRRLFAGCVEALRSAPDPLNPEQIFPCVDKTRTPLFAPKGSNAGAAPSLGPLQPISARPRSIALARPRSIA